VASIQQLLSGGSYAPPGLPIWITVAGLPFALQLFFMMSSDPSPGAGDNLNSISMLASMAQHFHSERGQGCPLKHTRLIFLSTDGEEIGQRGAIRYVQSHHSQLRAMPTFVLNIDSIYHSKDLKILTRDRNSTCKLSNSMISDIFMVASELGLHLKRGPIPLGGGGTDAAAFATAGIKATSIIGMPTSFISKDHLYHTSNDTVDHIEADAVKAVLQLAVGYIRYVDDH
jgi:Zn-dependent M28 family amino/carboxypeptidase